MSCYVHLGFVIQRFWGGGSLECRPRILLVVGHEGKQKKTKNALVLYKGYHRNPCLHSLLLTSKLTKSLMSLSPWSMFSLLPVKRQYVLAR